MLVNSRRIYCTDQPSNQQDSQIITKATSEWVRLIELTILYSTKKECMIKSGTGLSINWEDILVTSLDSNCEKKTSKRIVIRTGIKYLKFDFFILFF